MASNRIPYSDAEMAWLFANRMMVISDYTAAFNAKFKRDVELRHLHGLRKRKGWKVGRAPGRLTGRRRLYSPAEIQWLKANCTLETPEYHRAFCERFTRTDVSAAKLTGLRKREGWKTGRTGKFTKGQVSPNKGKPCPEGKSGRHPNARRTQFKKGTRSGIAVELYQPIGTEMERDGYRVRKINDGMPLQARWRAVHLIRWEALHGPLPAGMCLKCLDGDKLNTDPANWELISRATLARLNLGKRWNGLDYEAAPDELKPAILSIAKLKTETRQKQKRTA